MQKTIDLTQNVAALCDQYPELIDIMVDLGFKPLANPMMRKIAGARMTIPEASEMRSVPLDQILFALAGHGFAITGSADSAASDDDMTADAGQNQNIDEKNHVYNPHEPGHVFLARMGKTRLRPGGIDATAWLLDQVKITPQTKILEVACNMGTTLIQIAEQYGVSVSGLDLDEEALAHAAENVRNHHLEQQITLVHGSAFSLPFPDGSFDIVINEAMLTMLTGDQKNKALAEYCRVLKPGGVLLTQDVCLNTDNIEQQKELTGGISRAINVHVEPLTETGWKNELESHGFHTAVRTGRMTLLDPAGMEHDEGRQRTQEILLRAMQEENADFFERMFCFFNANKETLGYIAMASTKAM